MAGTSNMLFRFLWEVSAALQFESKELIFPPEVVVDFRFS